MGDSVDKYEFLAAQFRRDTGLMAPGKDAPPGMYTEEQDRERHTRWTEWSRSEQGIFARAEAERFVHVNELAQRVWPHSDPQVDRDGNFWDVTRAETSGFYNEKDDVILSLRAPSLEALVAALCVLAGEPPAMSQALRELLECIAEPNNVDDRVGAVKVYVDDRSLSYGYPAIYAPDLARHLLEAAKGGA